MRWSQFKEITLSLPLAVLTAILLIGINEASYQRSSAAMTGMAHVQSTHALLSKLLQTMLDAESSHRGYLLTGEQPYLVPYDRSIATISAQLDQLRDALINDPVQLSQFSELARQVARKLSEMDLSLQFRRQGNEDAWKFVLSTDVGKKNMDAIRALAGSLLQAQEKQTLESQIQVNRSLWLARAGIAAGTALGLLGFYMFLRQATALRRAAEREQDVLEAERARLEELVRERTLSLSELANHLQAVREDERGHLARELHDELGALLTAAKLDVARLKSKIDVNTPDIAERLSHLVEMLNSGIALKRRIVENLRPSSLAHLGLTAALEILAREYADTAGIQVETDFETVTLPEATELTVYRMVQESLTNIGKYADAQKITITVHNYPSHVAVQIRDDGKGFDVAGIARSSHGLVGMRQRVEAAGGRLTVASQRGQGTLVSAILPLA
ncbi:CHASE3 domain-containing protein [Simplicispira psychrophila]|uniref:sensor histidine kinase n=1 Tax=Simplicispira psychrophila TaxID=80882 RepID=UPI00047F01C1|nr:CHASE3 domain-containing protein [Simplicispira psychrophila]